MPRRLVGIFCLVCAPGLAAHQPVMDMAPRWQDGWGFQVRYEHRDADSLLQGGRKQANPLAARRDVHTTWLEGVYTFRRELRATFKLPWIEQSRITSRNGVPTRETGSGIGDLVIGLPLKRYKNQSSSTGNLAVTPSIRLPTGSTRDAFPVGDGSTDFGLSLSASFERSDLYQYYDLFYWANGSGDRGIDPGNELGLDINIGWHPLHDNLTNSGVFLMLDISARHENAGNNLIGPTGGSRISTGPVLVWYRGGMMLRAEWKVPVHESVKGTQVAHGDEFSLGAGFVF